MNFHGKNSVVIYENIIEKCKNMNTIDRGNNQSIIRNKTIDKIAHSQQPNLPESN